MDKTVTARLANGRTVTYTFPFTPFMEFVCQHTFTANEYPNLPFLRPRVIVDVGANVGCTALMFAGTYPEADIYAIEPGKGAYEYLVRNTAPWPRVKTFHFGAFSKAGQATLFLGKDGSVANSLSNNLFTQGGQETITLRRLSDFLREERIEAISLLKLDTEGAEVAILSDIEGMLERIEVIMLEYHSETDRLAIDGMLSRSFTLFTTISQHPHRGASCYVAKQVVAGRTEWDKLAIEHLR